MQCTHPFYAFFLLLFGKEEKRNVFYDYEYKSVYFFCFLLFE